MESEINIKKLNGIAKRIRQNAIKAIILAGSGHCAGTLGIADVLVALYFGGIMRHDPSMPNMRSRDRFFLSAGHLCPALYASLAEAGYFPKRELWSLRKLGSPLQGHTYYKSMPGVENTSGPLGHGISVAVGTAYALRHFEKSNQTVFCLSSDGEHDEGQTWEAIMFAGSKRLPNLKMIIDRNNIQSDGATEDIMPIEPLAEKYESFNWRVLEVDGHNIKDIIDTLNEAKSITEKPVCVIAHTIPGKGVKFMEGSHVWHAKPLEGQEASEALKQLGLKSGL